MLFAFVLLITTLAIAGSAAGFSIYGLANIFGGAFLSVVAMGISLEAGKLVAASYLYRFWDETSRWLRIYLFGAIFVLMVITSTGIFGYLSAAYQSDTLPLKEIQVQIDQLKQEKQQLEDRKAEMDRQITELPNGWITARQRLMESFKPEFERINDRLPGITEDLHKLQQKIIQTKVHTGPITYIADAFGAKVDDATKWIIGLLIIVFDPLAVALTIATNKVYITRREEKVHTQPVVQPMVQQAAPQATPQRVDPEVVYVYDKTPEEPEPGLDVDDLQGLASSLDEEVSSDNLTEEDLAQVREIEEALRKSRKS